MGKVKRSYNFIDITGKRYGKRVVLREAPTPPGRRYLKWVVRCDCGKVLERRKGDLIRFNSCGCDRIKSMKTFGGMSADPKYKKHWYAFTGMHRRCYIKTAREYKNYGAIGIKVCKRWSKDLQGLKNFIDDVGPCPKPNYSMDRIDPFGDYEPTNCRWASRQTQKLNQRPKFHVHEIKEFLKVAYLMGQISNRS